jgi:hypothetical protein
MYRPHKAKENGVIFLHLQCFIWFEETQDRVKIPNAPGSEKALGLILLKQVYLLATYYFRDEAE